MKPLYNYESGTGLHPCDKCGDWLERNDLEVPDGTTLELCQHCISDYMDEQQFRICEDEEYYKDELNFYQIPE